jgi:hypothetical protein
MPMLGSKSFTDSFTVDGPDRHRSCRAYWRGGVHHALYFGFCFELKDVDAPGGGD